MNQSPAQQSVDRGAAPGSSHLAICAATDIGTSRPSNQDTFVIADLRSGDLSNPCARTDIPLSAAGILLLVCDGMGGAAAGDLAAKIAAESIKHQLVGAGPAVNDRPDQSLTDAVRDANGAVLAEAELQALGTRSTIEPIISDRHLRRGDRILLCSDGLHGSIPDHQISEILLATTDINDCTRTLIRAALAAGGPDNVTVIVADCV